jgi:hypothetical protein
MKKNIFLGIVFVALLNSNSKAQTLQTVTTNGSTTDKVITAKGLIIPSYGGSISGADKWFNVGNFSSSGDFYMTRSAYHDGIINTNGLQHQTTGTNSVAIIGGGLHGFGIAISGASVTGGQNWNWQNDLKFKVGLEGNVGIGQTNPQFKLDVDGIIRGKEALRLNNQQIIGTDGTSTYISANGFIYFNHPSNGKYSMLIQDNGNIGMGTLLPQAKLHVIQESYNVGLKVSGGINPHMKVDGDKAIVKMQSITGLDLAFIGTESNSDLAFITNNDAKLTILKTGNIGIGTPSPAAKFDVVGSNNSRFLFDHNSSGNNYLDGVSHNFRNTLGEVRLSIQNSLINASVPIISNQAIMVGTSTIPSGYLMAVNGNVIANKIVVKQYPWADFVFKPDYKLPPLSIVEQHIKEKGHLQDIPSEKEVAEKGIDLGSMDAKLLQKVEELTLYLIDQQKQIDELKKQHEATLKQNTLLMQLIKQK